MRPLVEPGPALTPDQLERYARHLALPGLGEEGQRRLAAARVCVIGAGGLGAPVLQYLAAAGVGRITVVDDDDVDLSNLQRQVIHRTADVGRAKTASAAAAMRALNPLIEVVEYPGRVTPATVAAVLTGHDLILDGTDNFPTRYLVDDACADLGLPYVWGSVFRFAAQVSVFWADPPPGVPAVRLRDLFPQAPPPGSVPSCAEGGVLGAMCGQVGSVMATEAIKAITGIGDVAIGRVLVLDALAARWREVPLVGRGRAGWSEARAPIARVREVAAADLADELGRGARLVDVREPAERAVSVIPDAVAVPLAAILDGTADLPPGPLVLHCHSGVRSHQAALALAAAGRTDVANLAGGIVAWQREFARREM